MLELFAAIMLICSLIRTGYVIKNWIGEKRGEIKRTKRTEGGKDA